MRNVVLLSSLVCAHVVLSGCGGAQPAPEAAPVAKTAAPARAASCERQHAGPGAVRVDDGRQGSTVVLARLGASSLAYVADEDGRALRTIDVDKGVELTVTKLEGSPAQVLVLGDGRVAVSLRDKNRVQVLEPTAYASAPLESRCSIPVPTEPLGLAATPDDRRLLVTSAWDHTLTVLDTATMKTSFDVKLPREPRAVVVDDDGERAFVAHVVGAKMSVVDLVNDKHDVRELDLRVKKNVNGRETAKLREGCQGFALAKAVDAKKVEKETDPPKTQLAERPLGKDKAPVAKTPTPAKPRGRIFAPMVTVDPGDALVRSQAYYGDVFDGVPKEAPIVSVIDADAERPLTKSVMSLGTRLAQECLLPRSATVRGSSGSLFVTCLGIDAVVELDTRGLDPARLERRRWTVPSGPTGIAIDDRAGRAVVWSQFDSQVSVIDLTAASEDTAVKYARLTPLGATTAEFQLGRRIFHATDDRRISSDGTACASCHPDGREDMMTWSTPDGPRQTLMLAGRTEATAPYGWLGKHDNLKTYVTNTFTRLGGSGMTGADLEGLVAYLDGMRGPNLEGAPVVHKGELLARGKELFFDEQQGCATCHVGGPGTDKVHHDVGSKATADLAGEFDTPSLRFVSGTAPYFHDGRYDTLEAVLSANDSKMGHTMHLSKRDVGALTAYLEKL